jgi:anaerobic magnesium-protoporphyrin IX monomethyl ester cyclase
LILLLTTILPEKSPWGMAGKLVPLGLAYVAVALEKSGFQVEIYDNYLLGQPIETVKAEIRKRQPEIVGITCSSLTYSRCVEMAKAAKEAYPPCKVVVGGPHASYMPETLLEHSEVDFVVVGEGEAAMIQLAASIQRGDSKPVSAAIPGVACTINGEAHKTPQQYITDLDALPFPARHLLPMKMYDRILPYIDTKPVDTMSILRGCPYQCAYCETRKLWGTSCRAFSPQRVVDEIKDLVNNYGTRGIYFVGDNFTINKNRTIELCQKIKENRFDLKWTCETRADLVNKEVLSEMKSAGCQTIFFGTESGSERIQKKLNKNIDLQQVKRAFELTRQVGIKTATSFMLGIPGETVEDMHATLKYAKSLNADVTMFNIYIACPGSKLYDEVINEHLYDQLDNYLARVKTPDFDYDMLVKIQREFQGSFRKSMASNLIRVIKQEGIGSAVKKGSKLIFH